MAGGQCVVCFVTRHRFGVLGMVVSLELGCIAVHQYLIKEFVATTMVYP